MIYVSEFFLDYVTYVLIYSWIIEMIFNEKETRNSMIFLSSTLLFKGIHNPQYLPNDFFALSTFLDDLKPSHLNLSIQICP